MEVPKRCPALRFVLVEVHVRERIALPASHVTLFWSCSESCEFILQAPSDEDSGAVGQTLDASAYFANFERGLKDMHVVAGEEGGDGGAEASEACSDDYDLCIRELKPGP